MKRLGISPSLPKMKSFDDWLYVIPPFFIVALFGVIMCQMMIEAKIERREMELRAQREGNSVNMMKYFKKS